MPQSARGPVTGSFEATGASNAISGLNLNISLSGFGVGTVQLQRSFDDGSTWFAVKSYTADAQERCDEPETNVYYRLECTAYTSGTISYRLSQS